MNQQKIPDLRNDAEERDLCDRIAGLIWARVHLSRHTLDRIGREKLLVIAEALGIDVKKAL